MKPSLVLTLILSLLPGSGSSQEPKPEKLKKTIEPVEFKFPPSWDITCEVFSLTLSEAAKLKRARMTNAEEYAELVKRIDAKKVEQEEFLMVRAIEGQNTNLEIFFGSLRQFRAWNPFQFFSQPFIGTTQCCDQS